jgi:hypothetical protein
MRYTPYLGIDFNMNDEGFYGCTSCGEENAVAIDMSAGLVQKLIENCSICCHPNVIHVESDESGEVRVWVTEK